MDANYTCLFCEASYHRKGKKPEDPDKDMWGHECCAECKKNSHKDFCPNCQKILGASIVKQIGYKQKKASKDDGA